MIVVNLRDLLDYRGRACESDMAKTRPFTQTSSLVSMGGIVTTSAPNAYTQVEVQLPLSSLDQEVFVVTDIEFTLDAPEAIAVTDTFTAVQVTTSTQAGMLAINSPAVIGKELIAIKQGVVGLSQTNPGDSYSTGSSSDYISIIATPNYFIAVQGGNNTGTTTGACRVRGFRAKAQAAAYAALVTEELNQ